MSDPVMLAIATAVASKAAEVLTTGSMTTIGKLVHLVRDRFTSNRDAQQALAAAMQAPHDPSRIKSLHAHLEQLAATDAAFATELHDLWKQAAPHIDADHNAVVNQISGHVSGNVVQARAIQGNINFGLPAGVTRCHLTAIAQSSS